jgi:hypothetical protein
VCPFVFTEEAKKRFELQQAQEVAAMAGREDQSCEGGEKGSSRSPSRSKRKSTRRNKIESSSIGGGGESPKV